MSRLSIRSFSKTMQPHRFAAWALIGMLSVALANGEEARTAATRGRESATFTETADKTFVAGEVHLDTSRVYAHVGKVGLGHEHGVVGRLASGNLRLDTTNEPGQIVFDMKSFLADTPEARKYMGLAGKTDAVTQKKVNANMLGPEVLDVEQYPTATFVVHHLQEVPTNKKPLVRTYELEGDFTLHGVTNPVTITAEAADKDGWTHLRGRFAILQSTYGIKPFSKAFGAIGVADELEIAGDLWIAPRNSAVVNEGSTRRE